MARRLSFRAKTVLGVALIEAVLLGVLVLSVMRFLRTSNEEWLLNHARVTSSTFAAMTRDAIVSTDIESLQSFAHQLGENRGIAFARVLDARFCATPTRSLINRWPTAARSMPFRRRSWREGCPTGPCRSA
jgi:hypothetical protein